MPDGISAVMGNLILNLKEQESDVLLLISKQSVESIQGLVRLLQQHIPLLPRKILHRHALFVMNEGRIRKYCIKCPLLVLMLE